jgi:hypothetical protein
MNSRSNAIPESFEAQTVVPAAIAVRSMYWSIRREFWESRSIYIAPLAAAVVFLLSFLISMNHLAPKDAGTLRARSSAPARSNRVPYDMAAGLLMLTAMIVGMFYCLGALQGERRDRSILFWKSLPVSDLSTVLSKGEYPVLSSSAAHLCHQRCDAVDHIAAKHRRVVRQRYECRDTVDAIVILADVAVFALPSCDRACPLASADLWLAAAGLSLGAAGGISVGGSTTARDRPRREDCVQQFAFSPACWKPLQWRWCRSYYDAWHFPNESNDTPHSRHLPEQFGSVDRSDIHHSKHLRCGPAAPPSRPNLIVILLAEPKARLRDAGLALTRVPGFLLALLSRLLQIRRVSCSL